MNDERFTYSDEQGGREPDRRDAADGLEDRMLALAMGLGDDPELRAQLDASPELRARFQKLQDEIAAVEDGVLRAVPEEPAGWADLADERWSALRPYISTGQDRADPRATGRGKASWWRRWQALAPAAVAVVIGAVVLGVVLNGDGLQSFGGSGGGSAATDKAAESEDGLSTAAQPSASNGALAIEGASAYDTVVVARAGTADGGSQTFAVERTLKGSAPGTVRLETEVGGQVAGGSLAVLFLDPRDDTSPCPTPQVQGDGGATAAAPSPSTAAGAGDGRASADLYLYDGRCAAVVTLPQGVTAGDVQIQ